MNEENIKEILRRVDEFSSLDTRNIIAHATIGTHQICHISFKLRQLIEVSFMAENMLISVNRDEYVLNNWTKIPDVIEDDK